ncbi:alpha/beta fold hydrolase [Paenibacillus sp. Soil787]|uniref:alpha/beta fold hydrolase n=1 Tax=Paenibacillus sp. Soil787 TaxID=1736411 RepID=UPI000702AEB4|nr:alpha/beta hydrolase [Paenibacillus sp. Soil787]KRF20050.1 proline iminopeptidase [Paenibacillus sp. Soil787]
MNKKHLIWDLLLRKLNQRKNAKKLNFHTPNGIALERFIQIGGIDQWITIRGEDRNKPVLFFIHGGPASTYTVFSPLLRSWEKYFTIVQWDQRGAGKTFRRNGVNGSGEITFDSLANDGLEVAEFLCKHLNQEKIILVGSSMGSFIGVMMVKRRPDLFHAYVGTDQNVGPDPDHLSYQMTLEGLRAAGNKKGVQAIERIGSDPLKWSRKDFDERNRWIIKSTTTVPNMIMDIMLPAILSSPGHTIRDIIDIFKGMNYSLDLLFDELMTFDIRNLGLEFDIPFFIFQGDTDSMTPTALAQAYFDDIRAPFKEIVLIHNAGHLAAFARTEQFLDELRMRLSPLVDSASKKDDISLHLVKPI